MTVVHEQPEMYDFLVEYCAASDAVRNYLGLTPLVLSAHLGKAAMFQHIYSRRRRAFYTFGSVTSYSLALREIDTVQDDGDGGGGDDRDGGYVPNALEVVLRKGHLDMLEEPLIATLVRHKWRAFARFQFLAHLAGYLLLEVSQTVLIWLISSERLWNGPERASQEYVGLTLAIVMALIEVADYVDWSRECYRRRLTVVTPPAFHPPLYPIPGESRGAPAGRHGIFHRLSQRVMAGSRGGSASAGGAGSATSLGSSSLAAAARPLGEAAEGGKEAAKEQQQQRREEQQQQQQQASASGGEGAASGQGGGSGGGDEEEEGDPDVVSVGVAAGRRAGGQQLGRAASGDGQRAARAAHAAAAAASGGASGAPAATSPAPAAAAAAPSAAGAHHPLADRSVSFHGASGTPAGVSTGSGAMSSAFAAAGARARAADGAGVAVARQRTRARSGGGDLPSSVASLKRATTHSRPLEGAGEGSFHGGRSAGDLEAGTGGDGAGGAGGAGGGAAEPHKGRLRAVLETTTGGFQRMLSDPWLFIWHTHLFLTFVHFVTWQTTYGGVHGPGPASRAVKEFDDVVVSLMGLTGWLAVIYFFRGFQATGKLAVILERCIVDVGRFVSLYM